MEHRDWIEKTIFWMLSPLMYAALMVASPVISGVIMWQAWQNFKKQPRKIVLRYRMKR